MSKIDFSSTEERFPVSGGTSPSDSTQASCPLCTNAGCGLWGVCPNQNCAVSACSQANSCANPNCVNGPSRLGE